MRKKRGDSSTSSAARVRCDSPLRVRSVAADRQAAPAGRISPLSRKTSRVASVSVPPAESPAMKMSDGGTPCATSQR